MRRLSALLGATAALALAAGSVQAAGKELKYAHFQSADMSSPKHAAALAFESCLEGKTAGAIDVQVYPASQLGNGPEILEALQLGSVQMGVVHDGPISAVYKPFAVFALPYLFDDQAMAWAVVDGPFGEELFEDMRQKTGIRVFGLADNGVRNFTNSVRPVAPPDMGGKIERLLDQRRILHRHQLGKLPLQTGNLRFRQIGRSAPPSQQFDRQAFIAHRQRTAGQLGVQVAVKALEQRRVGRVDIAFLAHVLEHAGLGRHHAEAQRRQRFDIEVGRPGR